MLKFLAILFFTFCVASCVTRQRCTDKYPPQTEVKDSIVYNTITEYRDSIINIAGETIQNTVWIRDTLTLLDTIIVKDNTSLRLQIKGGKVTAICKEDSFKLVINNLQKILTSRERFKNILQYVPKYVKERYIPKWVYWLILITVISIGWNFRNPLITILKKLV